MAPTSTYLSGISHPLSCNSYIRNSRGREDKEVEGEVGVSAYLRTEGVCCCRQANNDGKTCDINKLCVQACESGVNNAIALEAQNYLLQFLTLF